MALLLKYALDTGAIVGTWQSTDLAMLQAQAVAGDLEYGYLLSATTVPSKELEEDYQVVEEELMPKASTRKEQ